MRINFNCYSSNFAKNLKAVGQNLSEIKTNNQNRAYAPLPSGYASYCSNISFGKKVESPENIERAENLYNACSEDSDYENKDIDIAFAAYGKDGRKLRKDLKRADFYICRSPIQASAGNPNSYSWNKICEVFNGREEEFRKALITPNNKSYKQTAVLWASGNTNSDAINRIGEIFEGNEEKLREAFVLPEIFGFTSLHFAVENTNNDAMKVIRKAFKGHEGELREALATLVEFESGETPVCKSTQCETTDKLKEIRSIFEGHEDELREALLKENDITQNAVNHAANNPNLDMMREMRDIFKGHEEELNNALSKVRVFVPELKYIPYVGSPAYETIFSEST